MKILVRMYQRYIFKAYLLDFISFRALLRILHDVTLHLLTNTRQLRGQIDMTLVTLTSDYLYLLIHIVENSKI